MYSGTIFYGLLHYYFNNYNCIFYTLWFEFWLSLTSRSSTSREVEGIQTSENLLYARRAVVIAAGAWSNSLMKSLVNLEGVPDIPVQPRKVTYNFNNYFFVRLINKLSLVMHPDAQNSSSSSNMFAEPELFFQACSLNEPTSSFFSELV